MTSSGRRFRNAASWIRSLDYEVRMGQYKPKENKLNGTFDILRHSGKGRVPNIKMTMTSHIKNYCVTLDILESMLR